MSFITELNKMMRPRVRDRRGPWPNRRRGRRPSVELLETCCVLSGDVILQWNAVALDALKGDYTLGHTPDQGGPTRDSRALAIVHAAMFDAVNSIAGHYTPYLAMAPNAKGASIEVAGGTSGPAAAAAARSARGSGRLALATCRRAPA